MNVAQSWDGERKRRKRFAGQGDRCRKEVNNENNVEMKR